jgi:hypothetical protein
MRRFSLVWAAAALLGAMSSPHPAAALVPSAPSRSRAADPQADVGFLDVSSDPPAKIIVDDADTGKVTPQPHLELKAGHHKLTLVTLDGARKRTLGFNVEAGRTTKLSMHLAS